MLVWALFAKGNVLGKHPLGLGGASCRAWNFGQFPPVPLGCAVVRGVLQSELQQNEKVLGQVTGQGEWV